ncbi:MAG: hypothetical protein V4577_28310 [Bacteroidota bacterium]
MGIEVFIITGILGIPVFFLWKRAFSKSRIRQIAKYFWVAILTLITSSLLYVGIIVAFFAIEQYYPDRQFDAKGWQQRKDERYEYSEDIIESKMLIGKSKGQVRKLLADESNADSTDSWTYGLGFRPEYFNIDPDWLEVIFKKGRVIKVIQHKR